ncbi:uncharacterized protein LOC116304960 [Actinia tenebrosa]|uniref:Uncharacterized protein LOC116304960 n=1 Tax=Actinia tenebrosa TaxID=6105 RepID=A0A6P8IUL0_ACTTE|nr:uncharacterized protein LOC116304960 [Actinia tenebrosa]
MDVEKQITRPLLLESSSSNRVQKPSLTARFRRSFTQCAGVFYFWFLIFLLISLVVFYIPRVFICCIKYRVSSYQCNNSIVIEHDIELEMVYLTTQDLMDLLCLAILVKWHRTAGLKSIFRKLVRLPKFWSIVVMVVVSGCYMSIMVNRTAHMISTNQYLVLFLCCVHCICMALVVPVLNYTRINLFCSVKKYSKFNQILIKLTLFLQFVVNASMFWLGFLQLSFNVSGIDSKAKATSDVHTIYLILRDSAVVLFHYTVQSFLWHKSFEDDRNLLGYKEILE